MQPWFPEEGDKTLRLGVDNMGIGISMTDVEGMCQYSLADDSPWCHKPVLHVFCQARGTAMRRSVLLIIYACQYIRQYTYFKGNRSNNEIIYKDVII